MDTYWVPGVNNLGTYGRWAFAEFTDIYEIESEFKLKLEKEFDLMVARCSNPLALVGNSS
jgi:type III restriction enzyme